MTSQVRITVPGQKPWFPPRGFGSDYRRRAADPAPPDVLRDMLELVGFTADPSSIERWPLLRRVEAEVYAARVYLRASDNPIPVPPRPRWFGEPWKGREVGEGVFEQPAPTLVQIAGDA